MPPTNTVFGGCANGGAGAPHSVVNALANSTGVSVIVRVGTGEEAGDAASRMISAAKAVATLMRAAGRSQGEPRAPRFDLVAPHVRSAQDQDRAARRRGGNHTC